MSQSFWNFFFNVTETKVCLFCSLWVWNLLKSTKFTLPCKTCSCIGCYIRKICIKLILISFECFQYGNNKRLLLRSFKMMNLSELDKKDTLPYIFYPLFLLQLSQLVNHSVSQSVFWLVRWLGQTDGWQMDRSIDWQTNRLAYGWTDKLTNGQTDRQADRQTEWLVDRPIEHPMTI